ncbi:hypothetical protein P7H75_14110 [Vagococcus carniphilus]|uniref:hypothetical protein n=1 Tax=Vagococcus carniphilus TaxID=218144 RepID=UPI00288E1D37|nr:hypothetical protein [Vagococcus carniphilus]MDT2815990.1 hypothetical protein [Vagococcus carniphilus]
MTEEKQPKKTGMLGSKLERKSGNYVPDKKYDEQKENIKLDSTNNQETQKKISKSNERKNQQAQLKISQSLKDEIIAIKALTNTKYEYEVIQLLIDQYKKTLTPEDIKKLRLISELNIG